MTYIFLQAFFRKILQRDCREESDFVESKTAFRLHNGVCGVCRLHKRRQQVIAQ